MGRVLANFIFSFALIFPVFAGNEATLNDLKNYLAQFNHFADGSNIKIGNYGGENGITLTVTKAGQFPVTIYLSKPSIPSEPGEHLSIQHFLLNCGELWKVEDVSRVMDGTGDRGTVSRKNVLRILRGYDPSAPLELTAKIFEKKSLWGWVELENIAIESTPLAAGSETSKAINTLVPTSSDLLELQGRLFHLDPEVTHRRGSLRFANFGFDRFIISFIREENGEVIVQPYKGKKRLLPISGVFLAFKDQTYQLQLRWTTAFGVRAEAFSSFFPIDYDNFGRGVSIDLNKSLALVPNIPPLRGELRRYFGCYNLTARVAKSWVRGVDKAAPKYE